MHAHFVPLQHFVPMQKFVQDERPHVSLPPLDDDVEDPLLDALLPLELEDEVMQEPLTQVSVVVPPWVQSVQDPPPVPHAVSDIWQLPVPSQHPVAQLVESHVVPPLLLVPLELVDPPPSSPLLLVLDVELPELPEELL